MLQLKKIAPISLVFVLSLLVQNVFAQRHHHNSIDKLKTQIELSPEQESELQAIEDKYQSQIQALKDNTKERGENREAIKALKEEQRTEVIAILTPEQKDVLKESRAKRRAEHREKRTQIDKEGMKAELKTYRQQNIKPVIGAQRAKLETQLSDTDQATIASLRPVYETMKSVRTKKKDRNHAEKRPTREEKEAQRQQFEEKYANEIATLKALVEKYSPQINALRDEIEPQIEKWSIDTKAIIKKHLSDAGIEHPHARKKGHHHNKRDDKAEKVLQGERAKMQFLLLNPVNQNKITNEEASTTLSVYPNPLVGSGQVKYNVQNAGNIRLELRDESGNLTRVLVNDYRKEGTYTVDIDAKNINTGTYYLLITDHQGTTSKALVVTQ